MTQGDVRAIQLAKSALYAGARLLMDEFETDTLGRIVLAGPADELRQSEAIRAAYLGGKAG